MKKIYYDFHVHTCLSPCADDNMTPLAAVAMASAKGLDAIAICDHNSFLNVEVAVKYGAMLGVVVLPAMELQTAEEIHILCFFPCLEKLSAFYNTLTFPYIKNKEDIFGNQLIVDEDDRIVGKADRLLSTSCTEGIYPLCQRITAMGGVVYLAHIDRPYNGILGILGGIPEDLAYNGVEYTHPIEQNGKRHKNIIINSDAHTLENINDKINFLYTEEKTIQSILNSLKG